MIVRPVLGSLRRLASQDVVSRCLSVNVPALAKAADPVQQLFIDKIREYAQKSKAAGGKFVDASPEIQKELANDLEKAAKQYGGGAGVDMTKFPSFQFSEPKIDPINAQSS
ncbi:ATP synthase-coupling factor 6, mitochondrial [Neocloeon triangulifer]|uniref:ATP synthase-coupling factor 6, mitochondrial n=1 Tax=Neocloeon triangulifer TaxID=2078957 RepID=UPI00286F2860|nr:ATP synthase-coupling factor 6, mitochondrial [Neocloeon triangulifer]